jgi:hypothetical protein
MPVGEVTTAYGARPEGSQSKLSTYRDGWRILKTILHLFRIERPVLFYGASARCCWRSRPRARDPARRHLRRDRPGAALPDRDPRHRTDDRRGPELLRGLILDTVVRGRREMRRLAYLALPAPGDAIVITGSRIRRDPLSQDQPVTFVDQRGHRPHRPHLDRRRPPAPAELGRRAQQPLQQFSGNFGNPPDGGGVGAGAAEVDLRYLGSKRVLVLVDGLRYVNGASASGVPGSTDINSIPEGMIDRVEVLQDGASAVYGSDAIAGVVNIITRKKQDGLRLSAQEACSARATAPPQLQASWGSAASAAAPTSSSAAITSARIRSARAPARSRSSRLPAPPPAIPRAARARRSAASSCSARI